MLKNKQKALEQSCSSFALPSSPRLHMRALEPRILLDAAAVETAADAASEAIHSKLADEFVQSNFPTDDGAPSFETVPQDTADPLEVLNLQPEVFQRSEIVFVAADIDDPTQLLATLPSTTEVVFLNADQNGLSQIAETLSMRSDVDAIHILSHGSQGALALGGENLTSQTMRGIYGAQLAMIGDALSANGDILIYGCDFAGGDIGRNAVEQIARLTGADVAASDDLTGNAAQGGNWDLEVKAGEIETEEVAVQANWTGTLVDVVLEEYSPDLTEIDDEEEIGSTRSVGQTFEHDSGDGTYEVDRIEVVLRDTGGPAQDVLVTISDSWGGPTIAQGTISSTSLTGSFDHHTIDLDTSVTLNDSQQYYITLSTNNASETIETASSNFGDYTDGRFVNPNGTFRNNHDLYFKLIDSQNSNPVIDRNALEQFAGFRYLLREENSLAVDTITATDPDVLDTLSFSVLTSAEAQSRYPSISASSSADFAHFTIDSATGELTFATAPNFEVPEDDNGNNIYAVLVEVSDGNGGADVLSIFVEVEDVNDAPVAVGSTTSTLEDTPVNLNSQFVYSDEDGNLAQSITIQALDLGGGTLTHTGNTVVNVGDTISGSQISSLLFRPALHSVVPATIDYTSNDTDLGTEVGTVTINITPRNDAPEILDGGAGSTWNITVDENQVLVEDVDAFDPDLPADDLTFSIVGGRDAALFAIDENTGVLTFLTIPDFENPHDYNGDSDYFVEVRVTDSSGERDTQEIRVYVANVNDLPVATGGSVSTDEDVAYVFSVADFGYSDDEGDALQSVTLSNLSLAGGTLTHSGGTVAVGNGDTITVAQLADLTFTPAPDSSTNATFDYTVNDADLGTVSAVMTVQVNPLNDAPVATGGSVSTDEDVAYVFSVADFGYSDDEGDALQSVTLSNLSLAGGTLTHSGGTVAVGNGDTVTVAQLADLTFTPAPDSSTNVTFDYTVNDADLGTVLAEMTVQVNPLNDAPVATDTTITIQEDTPRVLNGNVTFTDAEGDPLQSITIQGLRLAGGTLVHSGGTAVNVGDTFSIAELSTLTFTPALNSVQTAEIDFTANDADLGVDVATLSIDVAAVNDVPVATGGSAATDEDTAYMFSVADFGYSDEEGDALQSVTLSNLSLAGGTLAHTGGTVTVGNGDTITAAQLADLTFTPALDSSTNATFDYTVNDANLGTVSAVMTVQVNPANDAPVATGGSAATDEDNAYVFSVADFNYSDDEGDALQSITLSNLSLAGGTLAHTGGTVTVGNGDTITAAQLADLTFSPPPNWFGNVSFDYAVNDTDAGIATATLNIAVSAVNDAPVATGGAAVVEMGEPYNFQSSDFGFSDVEGDVLQSITIISLELGGGTLEFLGGQTISEGMTVNAADIASLVFTPGGDGLQDAVIQYTANDNDNGAVVSEMVIGVVVPVVVDDMDTETSAIDVIEPEEETEEILEEEPAEETPVEEDVVSETNDVVEGTPSSPVVAEPPTVPGVPVVFEGAPVQSSEDIVGTGNLEETTLPPTVVRNSIGVPLDSYQPIPLPNHTFEPVIQKSVLEEIDRSTNEMREYGEFLGTDVAKISFTFGSLLSIGGVSWLLRGGALMAAFLSAMPAWSRFDPVTIVTSRRDETEEKESSEFDVMMGQVQSAQSQVKGHSQS